MPFDATQSLDISNPKDLVASGKVPLGLLPAVARIWGAVAMYCGNFLSPRKDGHTGYGPYNWRRTEVRATVYLDAMERHLLALRDGQWLDPASPGGRVPHLGFIIAGAAVMLDAEASGTLIDDRFLGPAGAELEKASAFIKDYPIPDTFSDEGSGPRICDRS